MARSAGRVPATEGAYVASSLFVVRAAVLPVDTFPGLAGEPVAAGATPAALRAEGRRALHALAREPRVGQALHAASTSLVTALDARPDGNGHDRACAALLRYLTRMSTRPTPHGLFAGVAAGTFAARTTAVLDDDPVRATRTRADAAWLAEVVTRVEADTALRGRRLRPAVAPPGRRIPGP
ncbi:lantibiotic dehydratase [Actinomadura sp. 3N407]|uniref:lantibiotic dehydratase n=1 Tax=Actinomadura sp. 3N407 TaxID=3457423 RepID=UPI003FCE9A2F